MRLSFLLVLVGCGSTNTPADAGPDATNDAAMDAANDAANDAIADAAMDATNDATNDAMPSDGGAGTFACGPMLMCQRYQEFCFKIGTTYSCKPLDPMCKAMPSCTCPNYSGTGMCNCVGKTSPDIEWDCQP